MPVDDYDEENVATDTDFSSSVFDDYDDQLRYQQGIAAPRHPLEHLHRTSRKHIVRFIPEAGEYVEVEDNTSWDEHAEELDREKQNTQARGKDALSFPADGAFDQGVLQYIDAATLNRPENAPLRHNLEVMRNFFLNYYEPPSGAYNVQEDPHVHEYLNQLGANVGIMLKKGESPLYNLYTKFRHPSATSISIHAANREFDGAVQMYQNLLLSQQYNRAVSPVTKVFDKLNGWTPYEWKLPTIYETPFKPKHMQPPTDVYLTEDGKIYRPEEMARLALQEADLALDLDAIGSSLSFDAPLFNSVDSLSDPVREEVIEIGREILRNLRLQFSPDAQLKEMRDTDPDRLMRQMQDLREFSDIFQHYFEEFLQQFDPRLFQNPEEMQAFLDAMHDANEALGMFSCHTKLHARDLALGQAQQARKSGNGALAEQLEARAGLIEQELSVMPKEWLAAGEQNVNALLGRMEDGLNAMRTILDRAKGTTSNLPENERALAIRDQLQAQAEYQGKMDQVRQTAANEQYQQQVAARRAAQRQQTDRGTNHIQQRQQQRRGQSQQHQSQRSGQASGGQNFGALLNQNDLQNMQKSVSTKGATGKAVQPNSAKKVIQDTLNRQQDGRQEQREAAERQREAGERTQEAQSNAQLRDAEETARQAERQRREREQRRQERQRQQRRDDRNRPR